MNKLMFTLKEAAEATGFSAEALKLAITQAYDTQSPSRNVTKTRLPRLAAKRPSPASAYRILATDLQAWLEELPDA